MTNSIRISRSPEEGPETPEALMISAMLESGQFTPESYRLTEDHLICWDKLWRFGIEHQQRTGVAPPLELIRLKFPDFPFTENQAGSLSHHAHTLHQAHASRSLRSKLATAIERINMDDLDAAYAELEHLPRPVGISKPASDLWDHAEVDQDSEPNKIPVPWELLGRVTGGIGPAELWYLAGRPGTGKTFSLCAFVVAALKAAINVRYLSLEMSAAQIHKRVRRQLAAHDRSLLADLDSKDRDRHKKAVERLQHNTDGTLKVLDPSHGKATNAFVREQLDQLVPGDLVVVDHVGLMYTGDGRRAIDDWRAMASISNTLKEDALATSIPILGAVQLNREAEIGNKAPKLSQLSQSDALGQDADVVITTRLLSKSTRLFSAEKVREGPSAEWWVRFDPARAKFDQISYETNLELQSLDEPRN